MLTTLCATSWALIIYIENVWKLTSWWKVGTFLFQVLMIDVWLNYWFSTRLYPSVCPIKNNKHIIRKGKLEPEPLLIADSNFYVILSHLTLESFLQRKDGSVNSVLNSCVRTVNCKHGDCILERILAENITMACYHLVLKLRIVGV